MGFDDVRMMLPVVVVEMFQKFSFGDDHAGPMHKILENPILRRRQINQCIGAFYCLFYRIQFQIGQAQCRVGNALASSYQGLVACDKLSQVE